MTDIVDRLRALNADFLHEEAADEIERLRAELQSITKVPRSDAAYGIIQCIADAALRGNSHG